MPVNKLAPPSKNEMYRINQAREMEGLDMQQRHMYQLYRSKPQLAQTPIVFQKPYEKMATDAQGRVAQLESWPIGEEGGAIPRPAGLPMGRGGIQMGMLRAPTSVNDALGDFASHIGNNPNEPAFDPKLASIYSKFSQSLDPKFLKTRYEDAVVNRGETRPFEVFSTASDIPALFRGYTFNQWPDEFNNKVFSPKQKSIMDEARTHLGMR